MRAGALRHRVRLEDAVDTRDSGGGLTRVWQLLDVVPASIESEESGEPVEAGSPSSKVRHLVRIRYRTGVTPAMRAVFRDRSFRILSIVDPDQRKKELLLTCIEKVGNDAA